MQVIGAGLPRTGTTSLRAALEVLLDGPCYHMITLQEHYETDMARWWDALHGDGGALDAVLDGYAAAVDWPSSLFWEQLAAKHGDALVVLSHRGDVERWWASLRSTIWETMSGERARQDPFLRRMRDLAGLGDDWQSRSSAVAMYERHFNQVVDSVDPGRLVIWQPEDGWTPLCRALNVPEPSHQFFHFNTTTDFRSANGLHGVGVLDA